MRLAKVRQSEHHRAPDTYKEQDDEQQDLPRWNGHAPEETPVSAIGLDPTPSVSTCERRRGTYPTQPVVLKDFRCEEPKNCQ